MKEVARDAGPAALVVRVLPEHLELFQNQVVPTLHKQARLNVLVGGGFAFLILAIFVLTAPTSEVEITFGRVLAFLGALVLPVWLLVLGFRRVLRVPSLAEVALTVADDHIVLGARERLTLFSRSRPEIRWDRHSTEAEFTAAKPGLTINGIKFTYYDGRKRRHEFLATDVLDTSVEEILAAVNRP